MTPTDPTPYTPTEDEVRVLAQWIAQAASDWIDVESDEHEHGLACTNWEAYVGDAHDTLVDLDARALESRAARDARVRAEQQEVDLAMHHAYRPEVVAEVAVCLDDDADWERIAAWCGGRIENAQDPSGEYTSVLVLPDGQYGWLGSWIVKRLDGTFAVRAEVEAPDADTLARVRAEAVRDATTKVWSCGVARSGYHNGARCTPDDPHSEEWWCEYRYVCSIPASAIEKQETQP